MNASYRFRSFLNKLISFICAKPYLINNTQDVLYVMKLKIIFAILIWSDNRVKQYVRRTGVRAIPGESEGQSVDDRDPLIQMRGRG